MELSAPAIAAVAAGGVLALIVLYEIVRLSPLYPISRKAKQLVGKHVVITGGSAGIGKALAIAFARCGAHVTIMARNVERLEKAARDIQKHATQNARVGYESVDVSDPKAVTAAFRTSSRARGKPAVVVICAGLARPGYERGHGDVSVHFSTTKKLRLPQMSVNYIGAVNAAREAVREMRRSGGGNGGKIVLVGSPMGQLGFVGYSAYAPSKWAVRGFAECLRNEYCAEGIEVQMAYPPDTETEGYAEENKTKPPECAALSESGGVYDAETVAHVFFRGILRGDAHIPVGFTLILVTALTAGVTPRMAPVLETLTAPILFLAGLFTHADFDSTVRKFAKRGTKEH